MGITLSDYDCCSDGRLRNIIFRQIKTEVDILTGITFVKDSQGMDRATFVLEGRKYITIT